MATAWVKTRSSSSDSSSPASKKCKIIDVSASTPTKQSQPLEWKVFHDSVHGHIKIHPVLVSVIDTPQFQRLRDLKQLGASYWVFPGGCHNRFEHSLGTAYLCGTMLNTLSENAELHGDKIPITKVEKLCVQVAGLCHDLGHGPFSHVFDGKYIKSIDPYSTWTHEQASCDMFDYMLKENPNVVEIFNKYDCGEKEFKFIKDMIRGLNPKKDTIDQVCSYDGNNNVPKWFLYEIVNNKRSGIDCDKFDYFARDCHYIGTANSFDYKRFFQSIRIICVDEQLQICIRDKECFNLYEMFHVRWSLHHRVYQHKTTKAIEQMIVEALLRVDKYFGISSSIHDMSRYIYMNDSIIYDIMRIQATDENPEIKEAQALLKRVQKRDLFQYCGQVKINENEASNAPLCTKYKITDTKIVTSEIAETSNDLDENDIFVEVVRIAFGMNNSDFVDDVVFYNKEGRAMKLKKNQISEQFPTKSKECYLRVYSRESSKKSLVEIGFEKWCHSKSIELPNLLYGDSQYFTNLYKSSAEKKNAMKERSANLKQNPDAKRSIEFGDDKN